MQGENRAGRNALREKEGSEKRASGQAGCGVPSLLSFLFPECPPYLGVLSPPRCGEWATSLARALPTTTPLYGSPPYVWGEMHCWYGSRPVPRGKAMRCVWARVCAFSRFRSLALLFTVGKASRWIRVNAVRLTLIRRRSFIRTASSLFDAKPLYTHTHTANFGLFSVISVCVCVWLLRAHPDSKWIFTRFVGRTFSIRCVGQSH